MTKEEAYNSMIQGMPVSHKNFGPGEFLWMDDNFIIKDEEGDEFEESWDVNNSDSWKTGWYIYKNAGKEIRKKMISNGNAKQASAIPDNLIPHRQNEKCPSTNNCLQYNLLGEYSCVICDCKEEERLIDNSIPQQQLLESSLDNMEEYIESVDNPDVMIKNNSEHKKKGKLKSFFDKLFIRRKKNNG